jgi:hypothetical protein
VTVSAIRAGALHENKMSLALAAALAVSAGSLPVCSWDRPGHNPFKGDTVAAVDRYADIPAPVRAALKQRMAKHQYDEIAAIRRDSIEGRHSYSELRDMHFGQGQVCRTVTRDKWAPDAVERGLVYCESGHCLIVPTVCRNVSRVTRLPLAPAAAGTGAAGEAGTATAPQDELLFDPPAAGPGSGTTRSTRGASYEKVKWLELRAPNVSTTTGTCSPEPGGSGMLRVAPTAFGPPSSPGNPLPG